MKLRNWLFGKSAEKEYIEFKQEYQTAEEKREYDARQEELRKIKNGEEINPPWVKYHSSLNPWELRHEHWLVDIWLPFWRRMNEEQRQAY